MVAAAVLCVIISMTLQVPELSVTAYMPFFVSKESKLLTTLTGVGGVIGLTIGIGATLLLYKFTYGHPELRIPGMAIALFLGMWLSRVFVIGPLGFLIGFVVAVSQSVGEAVPSPELLVRGLLWLWVAIAYGIAAHRRAEPSCFCRTRRRPPAHRPKPKGPSRTGVIYLCRTRSLIPRMCISRSKSLSPRCFVTSFMRRLIGRESTPRSSPARFIALESTGATLHKGVLRIGGCIIGGALALFTIVFLMPHMDTIASLVVVVACASAIAGWVAAGSELISYAGLQIAFAFFYSVFQGYAPDTDLDNVRNRVVGILFGLIVTGLVFRYIWPERTIDRLRAALRVALQQLARLVEIPRPETSIETTKADAHRLIGETSKSFDQARRYVELTQFESEESSATDQVSTSKLENILVRAEEIFASAKSLVQGDERQDQTRTALLSEITAEVQRLN